MAESVKSYPRWQGDFTTVPRFLVVAQQEVRRAYQNSWTRAALMFAVGYAIITVGTLGALGRSSAHTTEALVEFLEILRWAALAIASIMAGPALLDDAQRGALEQYHARGVSRWGYLGGKVLAIWGLAFAAVAGPGVVYYLGSFLIFDTHPEGWGWTILGVLGDAALWSLVITGLGLGLSAVARSSRAATLLLFGAVAGLDIVFGRLLNAITKDEKYLVLSPIADVSQQSVWLFGQDAPHAFPWWWGLIALVVLLFLGWGLVWLRQPRLKGVE